MLNNPSLPQIKVIVMGILAAVAGAVIDALQDSEIDWRTLVTAVLSGLVTGITGYLVRETNPSSSAIRTVRERGL